MSDYLGTPRSNGTLKQLAPKPTRTQSMRLRVALIAAAALVLGVTGLIAQAVSDGAYSLSILPMSADSTFTTLGGKIKSERAAKQSESMNGLSLADNDDIRYGPPIVDSRESGGGGVSTKAMGARGIHMAKDGWIGAKTPTSERTPTSQGRTYPEKTAAPEKSVGGGMMGMGGGGYFPAKSAITDYAPKKDDYYTPKKEYRAKSPPAGEEKSKDDPPPKFDETPKSKESPVNLQEPVETNRKIIRTGEMDFEIDSYDVAVVNITKNLVQIKGAFISDSKSGQLKNGKLHGYVVVRMPPQFLDQFILDLRRDLGKIGELKTQRINSQDVTKQYTDIESGLKAARTMEERFLQIIKTGKGEIKDLIAAENALGEWRTKIEKMEGELRYYANQVGLSTLTISLSERELQTPFALVATETVTMRIDVDDVLKAHGAAESAAKVAKGRIVRSESKRHAAGQFEAILHVDLPPGVKIDFSKVIENLGNVSAHESHRQQQAVGGAGKLSESIKEKEKDTRFELTFNNLVNIAPRKSTTLQVATPDVAAGYQKLHDVITRVRGQVRSTNLNETDKKNINASIDFTVMATDRDALDKAIADVGPIITRNNLQVPIAELATDRKFGYHLSLVSVANMQAREKTQLKIEVKDVDEEVKRLKAAVAVVPKARLTDSRTQRKPNGEVAAILAFDVPIADKDALVRQFKEAGTVLGQEEERFPQAPDNELSVAHIHVIIAGRSPYVPDDEGFGSYLRSSAYLSFRIFATCLMLIIIGVSAILPWALLIWGGYKLYSRISGPPAATPVTVQPVAESETPAQKV